MKSIRTNPTDGAPEGDERPAPGTRVRIVDAGLLPSMRHYAGREGITDRPEDDGCYVRFTDGQSYIFCFWPEMERL